MSRIILPILLMATLLGCAVGPDYEKPETQLPPAWISADGKP